MRQYWRDLDSLERWSHSEPHKLWWQQFLRDSGGTGFWHETYFMGGGIEAIYDDMNRRPAWPALPRAASARRNVLGAAQGRAQRAVDGRARDHRGGVLPRRLASRPAASTAWSTAPTSQFGEFLGVRHKDADLGDGVGAVAAGQQPGPVRGLGGALVPDAPQQLQHIRDLLTVVAKSSW